VLHFASTPANLVANMQVINSGQAITTFDATTVALDSNITVRSGQNISFQRSNITAWIQGVESQIDSNGIVISQNYCDARGSVFLGGGSLFMAFSPYSNPAAVLTTGSPKLMVSNNVNMNTGTGPTFNRNNPSDPFWQMR
jgi:hypothetical protein